jgi:hypothetical protein|eukprot:COSAG01_NODE_11138_length_1998_cov_1.784623_3_plen_87_part_00
MLMHQRVNAQHDRCISHDVAGSGSLPVLARLLQSSNAVYCGVGITKDAKLLESQWALPVCHALLAGFPSLSAVAATARHCAGIVAT